MKQPRVSAWATILFALFASPALAEELSGENLLASLPPPFELGWQTQQDNLELFEYVPHGEKVEDWSRMITIQVFHGKPGADGSGVGSKMAEIWERACTNGSGAEATSGTENGYGFAVWSYDCPLNPESNKPETMFLKAMIGVDALYVVQYAYRAEADEDMVTEAITYLKTVGVCDTRVPEQACPAQ